MKHSSSLLIRHSRALRRYMTDAERILWRHLRGRRLTRARFRRQQVLAGRYIADFVSLDLNLVIEIDGGQHAERTAEDQRRTALLQRYGFRVLRFWNTEVLKNLDGVLEVILQAVAESSDRPHPDPLPHGRGGR